MLISPVVSDANQYALHLALNWDGDFEPGWLAFSKLVWAFNPSAKTLVLATGLFAQLCFTYYCWKRSTNFVLSYFIFICLGIYGMTFYILRQSIALGLVMLAYVACAEKKPLKFFVWLILAMTFHRTAAICLILYPLSLLRRRGLYHICAIAAGVLLLVFGQQLLPFVSGFARTGIAANGSVGISYLVLITGIAIFVSWADSVNSDGVESHAIELGAVVQCFAITYSNIHRVISFFEIGITVALPHALRGIESQNLRVLITIITVSALGVYYLVVQDCAWPGGSSTWYMQIGF